MSVVLSFRKARKNEALPLALLLEADPDEERVHTYCARSELTVVEMTGRAVGVYVLDINEAAQHAELLNLAIGPEQRGRGIGQQIMKHILAEVKVRGVKKLEVGTGNSSIGQLAFYQKCGFEITGIRKGYFLDNYPEPIFEDGIQCRDMIRLAYEFK